MNLTNDDTSFGTLVKTFRHRRRCTQQHLADALGVHRSTVFRWEQGTYLPENKAQILELARCLTLDDQETRRLLEASLTALAPYWSVPLLRNRYFTGREEILEALHTQLGIDYPVALTQSLALHGLGGVGKTQIALEYAYRHALEYSAVFWIEDEHVVASLLRIAETLQLPEQNEKDQQQVILAIQRWLSIHSQWLLIWDNVEDLTILRRLLPSMRSGALLLTTRRQVSGTLARSLNLCPMGQEEGLLFLLRRAKLVSPEATGEQVRQLAIQAPLQYTAAWELVTVLGGLPLALDQAGAYLEETHCRVPAYLELFRTRRDVLLQRRGEGLHDHPASVSTTFTLAIMDAAERHPAVKDLLQVCAFLQPDGIPEELFRQGGNHLGAQLQAVCRDPLEWDRVIGLVCSYSLLSRQHEEQTLSIHRLVQVVLKDMLPETVQHTWKIRVLCAISQVFPSDDKRDADYWRQCERLLSHALHCLAWSEAEVQRGIALTTHVATYFSERSRYVEAEGLYLRAVYLGERTLGTEHPQVGEVLSGLAILYRNWGKYAEAEAIYQRVLSIQEQTLGADHPQMATVLHNLGESYREQGRYAEAEPLFLRALHIWEQGLGPEHRLVATALTGLALLSQEQSRDAEAETLFQRALTIQEQHVGLQHPDTAQTLHGLAVFRQQQGNLGEACSLVERALAIRSRSLGDTHPQTIATRALHAQLVEVQTDAEEDQCSQERVAQDGNQFRKAEEGRRVSLSTQAVPFSDMGKASFAAFLAACCELHPYAWCRSSDLWQAYERWVEKRQDSYPLSRVAFTQQLKAAGCQTDRTNRARIWRGITLVDQEIVTGSDG